MQHYMQASIMHMTAAEYISGYMTTLILMHFSLLLRGAALHHENCTGKSTKGSLVSRKASCTCQQPAQMAH